MIKTCYICKEEFNNFKYNEAFFTDEKGIIFKYDCCHNCEIKVNKTVRDYVRKLKNYLQEEEAEIEKRK